MSPAPASRFAAALLAALLLGAPAAAAQSATSARPADCQTDLSQSLFAEAGTRDASPPAAKPVPAAPTPAEERVREIVSQEGVHLVRLWAPWCANSIGEMRSSWDGFAEDNEDVTFTFVTVWNNGDGGASTIEEYGLSLERITEVVPAAPEQGRLDAFMGYAVNWVPSTWIFRTDAEGHTERAFALNYGEMDRATLQTLVDAAQADW